MVRRQLLVQPLTFRHAGLELEIADLLIIQHCGHITVFVMFSGDQSRTESTHDTGDVGRIAWQSAIFSKLREQHHCRK